MRRTPFSKIGCLAPRCADSQNTRHRTPFFSRCPRGHLVLVGLAAAAATVFLDRAVEEHWSTFCTGVAAKLGMSHQIIKKKLVRAPAPSTAYLSSSCSFYSIPILCCRRSRGSYQFFLNNLVAHTWYVALQQQQCRRCSVALPLPYPRSQKLLQ